MTRNLNGEKRGWILLWIFAVISLLCVAKGKGLASHSNNMHSLQVEKQDGTINGKGNHEITKKHHETIIAKDVHEAVEKKGSTY